MVFSKELEQIILKFVWKNKKTSKGQYNFVKEQSWRDHAPWLDYTTELHLPKEYGTGTKTYI